jgi:hypothetical protein
MRLQGKDKRRRKARIARFCKRVCAQADAGLEVVGVVEDQDGEADRVVILVHRECQHTLLEPLVARYFSDFHHKVVYLDDLPRLTAGIQSGEGIRRADSTQFGTLSGVFKREAEGPDSPNFYGLSNMHVLGPCGDTPESVAILDLQGKELGRLVQCVPLLPGDGPNFLDAAVFRFHPGVAPVWDVHPDGLRPPVTGLPVRKRGAASAITTGQVNGRMQIFLRLGDQRYLFQNVISIQGDGGPFSTDGDSGAMVMSADKRMVGVLFAALGGYAYAFDARHLKVLGLLF